MNTNSNVYTVVYTTVVCALVAAVLAFASQSLKAKQEANEKAENISQVLTAAQFGEKDHWSKIGNDATIKYFEENIASETKVCTVPELKALNYQIKDGSASELPVYTFKNGVTVIPVYGAGLWGPVWGYLAFAEDLQTLVGAYFDHDSETPGLGGKIKDDPSFRAQFVGKKVNFSDAKLFAIVKGGTQGKENAIDAISGATMTSKGVDAAINAWLEVYKSVLVSNNNEAMED